MSFRSIAVGLSLLAGLYGCALSPVESDEAKVSVAVGAIKGGYPDPNDTAVVDIVWLESNYYYECSGSLIAPNIVLTARHCVADILNGTGGVDCNLSTFAKPVSTAKLYVSTHQFLPFNPWASLDEFTPVKEVIVPTETKVCGNDVALLVLKSNFPSSEAVPLVPRVDTKLDKDDQYSAIGFGGTQDDGSNGGQRRRLDNLFVNCVTVQCFAQYVSITHEWEGDHGICEGDSGGPAIDLKNRVIGVTSRGGPGCTSPVYGYVFAWADWIKENTKHAADLGGYPLPPWVSGMSTDPAYNYPIGDPCSDPSACPSALCLGDGSGNYCTRVCSDTGPCPDGFMCATIGEQQFCQKPAAPPPPPPDTTTTTNTTGTTTAEKREQKSGCSIETDDPTKPVPWSTSAAIAAVGLALLRRRRRGSTVGR